MRQLLRVALFASIATPVQAQCETLKLTLAPPIANTFFGSYVALEGDTAAISFSDQSNHSAAIFERNGLEWVLTQQITFGSSGTYSVPIAMDGGTIFMGDMDHEWVGVFESAGGPWNLTQTLQPLVPIPGSHFGRRVVIDGDRAVVAAPMDETYTYRGGSVFVFERVGNTWVETAKIEPPAPRYFGFFGLAIDLDGDTIVVGEPGYVISGDQNLVYVYEYAANQWTLAARFEDTAGTGFGYGVAVEGDRIAVGARETRSPDGVRESGAVVFYEDQGGWTEVERLYPEPAYDEGYFGTRVLLQGDRLVVGAGSQEIGEGERAHVYTRRGNQWQLDAELLARGPSAHFFGPMFGCDLALDGDTLIVGSPGDEPNNSIDYTGAAYFYTLADLVTPYCDPAVPNSTGVPGELRSEGCATLVPNDLVLGAHRLPPNELGIFLASRDQDFVPMSAGSQGTLCLGGGIGRYVTQAANTGANGTLDLAVDLGTIPTPAGSYAAQPGETWYFQCWYRDTNPGPTSNFTDAVRVTVR